MNEIDQIAKQIVDSAFKTLGFLINFNVPLIKQGIRRIANDFQES